METEIIDVWDDNQKHRPKKKRRKVNTELLRQDAILGPQDPGPGAVCQACKERFKLEYTRLWPEQDYIRRGLPPSSPDQVPLCLDCLRITRDYGGGAWWAGE